MGLSSSNSRSGKDTAAAKRSHIPCRFSLDETVTIDAEYTLVGMAILGRSSRSDDGCLKGPGALITPHANNEFCMMFPCRVTIYCSGGSALSSHFYRCIGHASNTIKRECAIHVAIDTDGPLGTIVDVSKFK